MKSNTSERGQAIVFLIVGLVVFLGFVALAIDGGMAYADRRHAQNSSDSSSLAGGGSLSLELENRGVLYTNWNCGSGDIQAAMAVGRQASINRAAANGFTILDGAAENGVTTLCGETNYGYIDRWIDVTVNVSDTTTTSFAHLLFPNALEIRVEAVTRVRPRQPLAFGNAIVALNPANCSGNQNGAKFHGNPDVYVTGGGIWTNGCLRGVGNIDVFVEPPSQINYVAEWDGGGTFSPAPTQVGYTLPPESYEIDPPDCSHPNAHNLTGNQLIAASPLDPGLYCVNGDLRINGHDSLAGQNITIVMLNGELHINGNAEVQIDAPEFDPDPHPAIPGILIYAPPSNTNRITINGNSESYFEGTVLAPRATIDVLGNAAVDAYRTQVIGWNVEAGGTADTYVNFEEQRQYSRPTSLELSR